MIPYDVQLVGAIALHRGMAAEMATGEGKTLAATMPLYLNALPGKGAHLVTVNSYLAQRDAEWMGTIYEYLGLTVDVIDLHDPHTPERREAYAAVREVPGAIRSTDNVFAASCGRRRWILWLAILSATILSRAI